MGSQADETISGSPTCARVVYLSVIGGELFSSDDIGDVLLARQQSGATIEVDHAAISHILHDGLIPPPLTAYRDVFAISVDLSAKLTGAHLSFERDFPFENHKSPLDGKPSANTLLDHLARATRSACEDSDHSILMLSAGLDSTSVAISAKEAGLRDLICVTHGESEDDFEIGFARATCKRLGLRHEAHIVRNDDSLHSSLLNYAASVPEPCADPALIACISLVSRFGARGGRVLDGSGNDYYFWRPPGPTDLLKTWLGLGRIKLFRDLRKFVPMHFRRERILATPLELLLLHGAWLRFSETRCFYPNSVDTHAFWLREDQKGHRYSREEVQHILKMVYMGPAAFMLKTRNAASAIGAKARFPWADETVADYCFSLPESFRFNRKRRKSKTIVREMLAGAIGYDGDIVGKRHFSFGKHRFLQGNLAFCRDEVMSCTLWSGEIEQVFDRLAALMAGGRPTENALLALLMVSLWHNHWVEGTMKDWLRERDRSGSALTGRPRSAPFHGKRQKGTLAEPLGALRMIGGGRAVTMP